MSLPPEIWHDYEFYFRSGAQPLYVSIHAPNDTAVQHDDGWQFVFWMVHPGKEGEFERERIEVTRADVAYWRRVRREVQPDETPEALKPQVN